MLIAIPLILAVLIVMGRAPRPRDPSAGAAALLLFSILPLVAIAQEATPTPRPTPRGIEWRLISTIGTETKKGADKTPIVGMRATIDAPLALGARLILRADLSRMSDGGAVDQGGAVPSFESGEIYTGIYRPVAGPVAFEVVVGRAWALDPDQVLEASPDIVGGGLRLSIPGGFVFVGYGRHGATGKGNRGLVSLLIPIKANTSLYVDGALGPDGKRDIRSGAAVGF